MGRDQALKYVQSACVMVNNKQSTVPVKNVQDVLSDSPVCIGYQKLQFTQWIALAIPFATVVKLINFGNISIHTFQGKDDETMQSSALSVHVQSRNDSGIMNPIKMSAMFPCNPPQVLQFTSCNSPCVQPQKYPFQQWKNYQISVTFLFILFKDKGTRRRQSNMLRMHVKMEIKGEQNSFKELYNVPQDISLKNICQRLKFGQCIAPEVFLPAVVKFMKFVYFGYINCQGKLDETMLSSTRRVHV